MGMNCFRGPNTMFPYLEKIRKEDPDLTLSYKDNTKGLSDVDGMFNYGFEIGFYLSDILFGPPAQEGVGTRRGTVRDDIATIHNRFDDNARIKITGKGAYRRRNPFNNTAGTVSTIRKPVNGSHVCLAPSNYRKMVLSFKSGHR